MSSHASDRTGSGGFGLAAVLTIVFVVLKLIGVITWSWWWVLSPLWISALIAVAILLLIAIGLAIYVIVRAVRRK